MIVKDDLQRDKLTELETEHIDGDDFSSSTSSACWTNHLPIERRSVKIVAPAARPWTAQRVSIWMKPSFQCWKSEQCLQFAVQYSRTRDNLNKWDSLCVAQNENKRLLTKRRLGDGNLKWSCTSRTHFYLWTLCTGIWVSPKSKDEKRRCGSKKAEANRIERNVTRKKAPANMKGERPWKRKGNPEGHPKHRSCRIKCGRWLFLLLNVTVNDELFGEAKSPISFHRVKQKKKIEKTKQKKCRAQFE